MFFHLKLFPHKPFLGLLSIMMLSIGICNPTIKIVSIIDLSIRNVISHNSNMLTDTPEIFIEFAQLRSTDYGLYIPYRIRTTSQEILPTDKDICFSLPDNEFIDDQPIFITERLTIGSLNLSRTVTINIKNNNAETVVPITIKINENGAVEISKLIAVQKSLELKSPRPTRHTIGLVNRLENEVKENNVVTDE